MTGIPHSEYIWLVISTVVFAITFPLVVNRLYIRIFSLWGWNCLRNRKAWNIPDAFVFLAWVTTIPSVVYNYWYLSALSEMGNDPHLWADDKKTEMLKFSFVITVVYWLPMYLIKGALLFFYAEFMPRFLTWLRWVIWVTGFLSFAGGTITTLIHIVGCIPVSNRWSLKNDGVDSCTESRFFAYFVFITTIHVLTDCIVFAIPFFMLRHMRNLSRRQRISALIMFALGLTSIACSILAAFANYIVGDDWDPFAFGGYAFFFINYVGMTEQTTAIAVACIPALRKTVETLCKRIKSKRKGLSIDDIGISTTAADPETEGGIPRKLEEDDPKPSRFLRKGEREGSKCSEWSKDHGERSLKIAEA